MTVSFIRSDDFPAFVTALIEAGPVYGPVAKRSRFVFERLETPEELRLDYDVTILPPKKLFFPPAQDLVRFDEAGFSAALEPVEKILLGVHFYDVKAIDQTDLLFSERNYDVNYMAHREATTIVASNVQNGLRRARSSPRSARTWRPRATTRSSRRSADGYVFETLTDQRRGAAAARRVPRRPPTAQIAEAADGQRRRAGAVPRAAGVHQRRASPPRCAPPSATRRCGTSWPPTASPAAPATRCAPPATASTCRTRGTSTRRRGSARATGTAA